MQLSALGNCARHPRAAWFSIRWSVFAQYVATPSVVLNLCVVVASDFFPFAFHANGCILTWASSAPCCFEQQSRSGIRLVSNQRRRTACLALNLRALLSIWHRRLKK